MTPAEAIGRAAYRLLTDPEFRPLMQAWELEITNAARLPSPIDPHQLSVREGDRLRLLWVKVQAENHRRETTSVPT
jgi:hypothetical protein